MIGTWIWVVFVIIVGLIGIIVFHINSKENQIRITTRITGTLLIVAIIVIASAIPLYYLYGTESGKRAIKDFNSNTGGGIERTVEIYDINGELIKAYTGTFDIDYDSERIKFDDENGKRHIIYYTTGTIIIDEK